MATFNLLWCLIMVMVSFATDEQMACKHHSICYACINSSCSWYPSSTSCIARLKTMNIFLTNHDCECLNTNHVCTHSKDNIHDIDYFTTPKQRQLAVASFTPYIESNLLSDSITQKHSILFISCLNHSSWNIFFNPLETPSFNDWLFWNEKDSNGQTFLQYYRLQKKYKKYPSPQTNTIGLLTIGDMINVKVLINNKQFDLYNDIIPTVISIFYGLNVDILNPMLSLDDITKRDEQLLTKDILSKLLMIKSSDTNKHLFCLIGITMIDLYPMESWNFVYGQAKLSYSTAVSSFNRYYDDEYDEYDTVIFMKRSIKVVLHEIGHLFGLKHCIHFECLMNGSNNMEEADDRPIHLCPICLHKLYFSRLKNFYHHNNSNDTITSLNILQRYKDLARIFKIYRLYEDAVWFNKRFKYIEMMTKKL